MQFYRRSNLIYYRFHITFIRYLFLIVNRAYKKKEYPTYAARYKVKIVIEERKQLMLFYSILFTYVEID